MSNKRFNSVKEALEMFKADPLLSEPGKEFHYTTHGFTLLSAVLEKADGERDFKELLRELFTRLDMRHTHLDDDQEPIVPHRTRHIIPELFYILAFVHSDITNGMLERIVWRTFGKSIIHTKFGNRLNAIV
jgi:CubicO group peptidase (beta-lactamase class C family)